MTKEFYIPPGGPPEADPKNKEIYALMGEENIILMMEDFYEELGKSSLAPLFPKNLKTAARKSATFFIFLMGGPPLYHQLYGPPMMRKRHLPFKINEEAKNVWLACFKKVLDNGDRYHFPKEHLSSFYTFLEKFAAWMVNTKE
jgi:hemoglobin